MNKSLLSTMLFLDKLLTLLTEKNHLHTSRFAYPHEAAPLMKNTFYPSSLLIGQGAYGQILQVTRTPRRRELGNILVCARARAGKGLLAIPQLLSWRHSVIVNDIKGELSRATAGYRATFSDVYFLDPRGFGHRFDPILGKTSELELKSFAKKLLPEPHGKDRSFINRAGRMLYALLQAARLEGVHPLVYLAHLINEPAPRVVERVSRVSPELAVRLVEREAQDADYDNTFFVDSWSSLTSDLDALLAESVVRTFTGSDFTMEDVMCGKRPKTVYLRFSEEDLLVLSPLIKLLWTASINGLTTTHDNRNGVGCNPVLLLLDEAAATKVPNLPEAASTVVGRGVSLWIAVQDLSQLDAVYGKDQAKSLRNNCDTHIYYRPNDLETAKNIEERLGRRSDYAQSRHTQEGKETSQGQSEQGIPLLTSRQIMEVPDETIFVFHRDFKPMRGKRMNWLEFPELVRRTQIPTPKIPVLPPLPPLPPEPPAKTDLPDPRQDLSEDRQDGEDGGEKAVNENNGLDGDAGFINPNIYTLEDEIFIANRPSTEATVIEDHVENTAKEVTTVWESKNGVKQNHQENNRKKM